MKTKQINITVSAETHKKLAAKAADYGAKIRKPIPVTTWCKLKLEELVK